MAGKQDEKPLFAYIRAQKVMSRSKLASDTRHAARDDAAAIRRRRADADPKCMAMAWRAGVCPELGRPLDDDEWLPVPMPPPLPEKLPKGAKRPRRPRRPVPWVVDLRAAVDEHMEATGAQPHWRHGQAFALSVGVGVSRDWLAEGGAINDPQNPRHIAHQQSAQKWLRDLFGPDLVAMRTDYDEHGTGWIDAYVVPVRDLQVGGRPSLDQIAGLAEPAPEPNPTVAVTAALAELNARYNYSPRARPFIGLGDDWHTWAFVYLDQRFQRGVSARITRARNVRADEFRAAVEAAETATKNAEDRRDAAQAEADAIEAALDDLDNRHTRTRERIQADHDLASRIRHAARNIQNGAQIIQDARNTLPDELLILLEDPDIANTLARITAQKLADLPDLPEPEPGQQSRPSREDEDEPGRPG